MRLDGIRPETATEKITAPPIGVSAPRGRPLTGCGIGRCCFVCSGLPAAQSEFVRERLVGLDARLHVVVERGAGERERI